MIKLIRMRSIAMFVSVIVPTFAAAAGNRQDAPPLVSLEQLQGRLNDAKVRILDARPRADYDRGHIPGAIWADYQPYKDLTRAEAIRNRAAWARALAPLGLSPEVEEVYVYDAARQHDAARLWWLLSYAGVKKVGLVDGGFGLWEKEHRPVTSETTVAKPADFVPEFQAQRVATRDDVRDVSRGGAAQLLDARGAEEYRGDKVAKGQRAGGHIPGARSLDGYSLVDEDGRFRKPEEQRQLLTESGITVDRPVIAYSNGGARSAVVAFAFERLGLAVRHYVPGLSEWASDPQAPITSGREAGHAAR